MSHKGWIGVDLDGTLAEYDGWKGELHIGAPIPAMVERVKQWLAEGKEVRVFTARVYEGDGITKRDVDEVRKAIVHWCRKHIGYGLPVTNVKDYQMIELWDDRAVQIIPNTGRTLHEEHESVIMALQGKAAEPPQTDVPPIIMQPVSISELTPQDCTRGAYHQPPCNGFPTTGCPIEVGGKPGWFMDRQVHTGVAAPGFLTYCDKDCDGDKHSEGHLQRESIAAIDMGDDD